MNIIAPVTAATILKEVFIALRETCQFLVLRNYENLPDSWGNDIDILVPPKSLHIALFEACSVIKTHAGDAVVEVKIRFNYKAVRLKCADRLLHIDFIGELSWMWMVYADTTTLLECRQNRHQYFHTPQLLHELLVIAAKELFAYGFIRERYHARLKGHEINNVNIAARQIFGRHMSERGIKMVAQALVDPNVKGRPALLLREILKQSSLFRWLRLRANNWTSVAH